MCYEEKGIAIHFIMIHRKERISKRAKEKKQYAREEVERQIVMLTLLRKKKRVRIIVVMVMMV